MAVQNPPALSAMRPGLIDPSRQAEYPILLGKSLSEKTTLGVNDLLNVRYNWKSKQIPQRQIVTNSHVAPCSYRLVVREDAHEPYKYDGSIDPQTSDPDMTQLALIFDKKNSVFVMESICGALNLNLTSATTKPNIDQLPKLQTANSTFDKSAQDDEEGVADDGEESGAEEGNHYDYRHFLAEARMGAEAGNGTAKTSAISAASPTLPKSKIVAAAKPATPVQSPFLSAAKRRKVEPKPLSHGVSKESKSPASNLAKARSRAGAATSKQSVDSKSAQKFTTSGEKKKGPAYPTKQQPSRDNKTPQQYALSPQIIVDEASDLTIDMGSPPPAAKPRHKINLEAFSGHSRAQSRAGTASLSPQSGDTPGKQNNQNDKEVDMKDTEDEDDDDVEDLALPSPRETRAPFATANRITQDSAADDDDDDDDDGLAAELEAVFEREDDTENVAVGLGISGGQADDESEVSEEE
jgi:RNA polymerase II transcription elongation factor